MLRNPRGRALQALSRMPQQLWGAPRSSVPCGDILCGPSWRPYKVLSHARMPVHMRARQGRHCSVTAAAHAQCSSAAKHHRRPCLIDHGDLGVAQAQDPIRFLIEDLPRRLGLAAKHNLPAPVPQLQLVPHEQPRAAALLRCSNRLDTSAQDPQPCRAGLAPLGWSPVLCMGSVTACCHGEADSAALLHAATVQTGTLDRTQVACCPA